jgi:CubicO group peptidase (beta-lactamase class C family)
VRSLMCRLGAASKAQRFIVTVYLFVGTCGMLLAEDAKELRTSNDNARPTLLNDLPSYIEKARKDFNVPGIAVAVVKDGNVVFERGIGLRNLQSAIPVDAHTMFCIASNTKSFTATAIEILADEGKLNLDDRVIDHLPWFKMSDPYATREIRIRDLLAHRSGLGSHAGDLLFVPGTTYSLREVVERLRYLPLSTGFRNSFAYENIMFAVATLIIEQASGKSYANFIQEHIFQPIRMTESRVDSSFLRPEDNTATSYAQQPNGTLLAMPLLAWKNNQGAAGIYSSVHDMSKWLQVQLANGKLTNEVGGSSHRLLSEEGQQRMWSMITPIDIDDAPVPELRAAQPNFLGYAEGWYLSDFRGQRLVWHDGGFPGTVSLVTMIPALHLGVVVLTNQQSMSALKAITNHILDGFLAVPPTDWIDNYIAADKLEAAQTAEAARKLNAHHNLNAKPSLDLKRYAGTYRDSWCGDIKIQLARGVLQMHFPNSPRLVGSLSPWDQSAFLVHWADPTLNADAIIQFSMGDDGRIRGASMRRASPYVAHAYDYQDLHLVRIVSEKSMPSQ